MEQINKVYNIFNFPYEIIQNAGIQKRRKGNQGRRNNKRKYKNLFCAFDIETTNDSSVNQAYMYIWQFQIESYTVIGRSWDDYLLFLDNIKKVLDDDVYLMVYVHNLAFEFSFLKGIYEFDNEEVFAILPRKVLKCEMMGHFEYRCSYLLTNMSLAVFTEKMGVEKKLSGDDFDYSIIRYPWTELTDLEMQYCIVDVKSLVEALKVYFSVENDNFYTIPLTSTGFVRRDTKRAMRHYNKNKLAKQLPDYELFKLMREAFRGGNTHANRYYADMVIDNVSSYDRVSSYPDVQLNELFPMGEWIHEPEADFDRVIRKIYKQKRACIIKVGFFNIRLSDPLDGCPYIAKHKCTVLGVHYNDNGRILDANYLEVTVTDIDLDIILNQYNYDSAVILDFYHTRYGKLPKPMREVVLQYYRDKTELKGVEGQELFYMLQKAKLNSVYGMCVQSPVKQNILYIDDSFLTDQAPEIELLEKHNKKAFLSYAWGIWTTAHARKQLQIAIDHVGSDRFVYCDTDSVKFIDDGSVSFKSYNEKRKKDSIKNGGAVEDPKGRMQYLGLYEYEGTYKKFVTMGAKKYAYIDQDDELHITVAGVSKSKGSLELAAKGGIDEFKEGFTFFKAGGTESVYNDDPDNKSIIREGKKITITSNVFIRPSTYTLGVTGEYRKILKNPDIWVDILSEL